MTILTWRLLCPVGVASAAALVACAQGSPKVCDDITIDSAGIHSFKRSRVEAVGTSHGLKGIADQSARSSSTRKGRWSIARRASPAMGSSS